MSGVLSHLAERWGPAAAGKRLSLALRCAVAGVFLVAAAGKMFDFGGLLRAVSRLGWLPDGFVAPVAALLLVAELSAGLLLLSGRGVRAGAFLGGVMAAAFMAVTATLIGRGVSGGCDCFGLFIKLPPWLMLGVDLTLFVACLALVALTAGRSESGADVVVPHDVDVGALLRGLRGSGRSAAPFVVSVYLVAMAVGLQVGFHRQGRRGEATERRTVTLRYGDRAPDFVLRTHSGAPVSPATLRGKWTLVCFVQPGCEPCERELRDIAARYPAWKPRLNVLVVLVGRPAFASPEAAARRFVRRLNLPLMVASDPGQKVTEEYCDRPLRTPFSVLLDSQGITRFVQVGRKEDRCDEEPKFGLVSDLGAMLNDEPFGAAAVYGQGVAYGRRAPDGELWVGEKRVRLSHLWRRQPVLLTFLARDCPACARHVALLKRALGNSRSITPVYVFPQGQAAAGQARGLHGQGLIAVDQGGAVSAAYRAGNLPATFLIKDGRLLYATGGRSTARELEQLVRGSRPLAFEGLPLGARPQTERR